ncbi:MAG TPA: carbohydrate kinase [Spirochaetes bacterium]|nr:carbohydrate kinase [Spirochaetota bacterium]
MKPVSQLIGRPAIFGEVLWDIFPDGTSVMGGAPFNVAWNLQGFGLKPLFISRIGEDALGERIYNIMDEWNMDLTGLQSDKTYPSGQVHIQLDSKGIPKYDILSQQAYDFIDKEALNLLQEDTFSLIYHGSLIERSHESSSTLNVLFQQTHLPGFVDINLREPWWDPSTIEKDLQRARWVKLNDEELLTLLKSPKIPSSNIESLANRLASLYHLELLFVTLGAEGAILVTGQETIRINPVPPKQLIDTVGAGDAFISVVLLGLTNGWPVNRVLERAISFASSVCEIQGATTQDSTFYSSYIDQWNKDDAK